MQRCLAVVVAIVSLLPSLLAAEQPGADPPAEDAPPNIVLILADDLGYGDLGCYGNQVNRTPHLDRLAREGMRFTDFYANASVCSPTRASLLTGQYPQRVKILEALGENARGLRQQETTIAEVLRDAGYATALMGKWHLGYHIENGPTRHGFETFVGHLHGATDYHSHVDKYGRMDWWHNEQSVPEKGYNTTLITRHSVRFIEQHRRRPFFLFVSHSAIHFPWMTPDDMPHRKEGTGYDTIEGKLGPHIGAPIQPVVQRMVEELDASVGEIVAALERLRLTRRTLVFFTSDNGGIVRMRGVPIRPENAISSNAPYRGQKASPYEGGCRVPAIAWWPGRIAPRTESTAAAATMDLFPTLLEFAGVRTQPAGPAAQLDGVSLAPVLLRQESLPERTLFWELGDSFAVRWRDWKLLSLHGETPQLFDLARDPGERRDLAAEHPKLRDRLLQEHAVWREQFP